MEWFLWENAWRAKASVLRAKALLAALESEEEIGDVHAYTEAMKRDEIKIARISKRRDEQP